MSIQTTMFAPDDGRVDEALVRSRPAYVPLIVGLGGGWNSTALLVHMAELGIRPDAIIFADTGANYGLGEKPGTYAHLWELQEWTERVGFPPLTIVAHVGGTWASLEDECLRKPTLPSRAFGMSSCAQKWKHDPMDKWLTRWPPAKSAWEAGAKPIKVIGYDGGEVGRAKILEEKRLRYWYPLIEWGWDRDECRDAILRAGMTLPPKSACFFCPSSTKDEVLWLAREHPDLFARAVAMEEAAKEECSQVQGLGRHWSWKGLLAADPAARAKMLQSPVEACMQCDDGGCSVEDT